MLNPSGEKTGNKKVDDMIEKKNRVFWKPKRQNTDSSQFSSDELGSFWTTNLTEDDKVVRR